MLPLSYPYSCCLSLTLTVGYKPIAASLSPASLAPSRRPPPLLLAASLSPIDAWVWATCIRRSFRTRHSNGRCRSTWATPSPLTLPSAPPPSPTSAPPANAILLASPSPTASSTTRASSPASGLCPAREVIWRLKA